MSSSVAGQKSRTLNSASEIRNCDSRLKPSGCWSNSAVFFFVTFSILPRSTQRSGRIVKDRDNAAVWSHFEACGNVTSLTWLNNEVGRH